jgi:hypothetical protein
MQLQAGLGLEPLIIIGVMIASAIFQAISKRKQDAESWDDWNQPNPPAQPPPPPPIRKSPPVIPSMLQPPKSPPPLPQRTVVQHDCEEHEGPDRELARLEQSQTAYARAATLQQRVESRLAEIDRQTELARAAVPYTRERPQAALQILQTFRRPQTTRQAFLASFVLNPPKALE